MRAWHKRRQNKSVYDDEKDDGEEKRKVFEREREKSRNEGGSEEVYLSLYGWNKRKL